MAGGGFLWFLFITALWGIGLVAHGFGVFLGDGYAERMTEREYEWLKGERK